MTLVTSNPKEIVPTESNERPIKAVLEVVEAKKQLGTTEEKEKRKSKEKCAEDDEAARLKKEKKEKKKSERKQRRREEKHLKKEEERRKKVESLDFDGESTIARVEEGMSVQARTSTQLQVSSPHTRLVASEDREDPNISPLMWCSKENVPQGSTSDPSFFQRIVEEEEKRKRELEEMKEKLSRVC
ncbi:nucleolar protein 58-like [Benincasa hispida]|uniref:nucleolar protein 58-like n=1 Tax=Benincasa hispida TaxID=102211 RepID=UPI001900EBEE|nr:nucleolar protein 58-like [Benincasa hispida]